MKLFIEKSPYQVFEQVPEFDEYVDRAAREQKAAREEVKFVDPSGRTSLTFPGQTNEGDSKERDIET